MEHFEGVGIHPPIRLGARATGLPLPLIFATICGKDTAALWESKGMSRLKTKCLAYVSIILTIACFSACAPGGGEQESPPPAPSVASETSVSAPAQSTPEQSTPAETMEGETVLFDQQFVFCDMFWMNNRELMVCQYSTEKEHTYQIAAYSIGEESGRVLYEWESPELGGGLFQTADGYRIFATDRMVELDAQGVPVRELPFASRISERISVNGEYAVRYRDGDTYIVRCFSGGEQMIFENTEEIIFHPISWSYDGNYLAVSKSERHYMKPPGGKPYSNMLGTEVLVLDRDGTPLFSIPVDEPTSAEWSKDSSKLILQRHPAEQSANTLTVVDAVSGETLCDNLPLGGASVHHSVGIENSVALADILSYRDSGLASECNVSLLNYSTGEEKFLVKLPFHAYRILFSPDGKHVAMAGILDAGYGFYLASYS
jgi:hypothetical protein